MSRASTMNPNNAVKGAKIIKKKMRKKRIKWDFENVKKVVNGGKCQAAIVTRCVL